MLATWAASSPDSETAAASERSHANSRLAHAGNWTRTRWPPPGWPATRTSADAGRRARSPAGGAATLPAPRPAAMLEFAYARLSDSLLAGRMPYAAEHALALAADGVTDVVNLCADREYWEGERAAVEAGYRQSAIREHRLPVTDGGTVAAAVLDRALAIADGACVYVHCRGGRERSAAVAVALLSVERGIPADDALALARANWPVFRPLDWQIAAVRAWLADARGGEHADRSRV